MSLARKADEEFGVPGTIANFDHPRILTIPKTEVVLPFLNEHLCMDMGFPGATQYLSCFVQEFVVLRPNVKIISGHAAPPSPLAQLAISSVTHSNVLVRPVLASRRAARTTSGHRWLSDDRTSPAQNRLEKSPS
jgi:hypothetical protein